MLVNGFGIQWSQTAISDLRVLDFQLEEFLISIWNCGSGRLMDLDEATHHDGLDIFFFFFLKILFLFRAVLGSQKNWISSSPLLPVPYVHSLPLCRHLPSEWCLHYSWSLHWHFIIIQRAWFTLGFLLGLD